MAQRKRTSEAELKKNRRDFLLLECGQGKHLWNNAAAPGYQLCTICKAVKRDDEVFGVEEKRTDKHDLLARTNREIRRDDHLKRVDKQGLQNYWS